MIYPQDFETITGFDRIRGMLAQLCRYETSAAMAAEMGFHTDRLVLENMYAETAEWQLLLAESPAMADFSGTADISHLLPGFRIENFYFEEESLFSIRNVCQVFGRMAQWLKKGEEQFPALQARCGQAEHLKQIEEIIRSVLDPKGQLLPFASPAYGKLGTEIDRMEREVRQVTRQIFRQLREAGYTAETDLTIREERLVIPVKAEHKRKLQGFVKDISATGQILYIEPVESLEMNNRLKELYAERRREREKILMQTTARLRPFSEDIHTSMKGLGELDFISARAALAIRLEAVRPKIEPDMILDLRNARNPLLWLQNEAEKKPTIPLWLKLDKQEHIMVISGPNAGGKSLALKTALLLPYMAQCGLFIPAGEDSRMGVFTAMALDCGDGQSIDEGLSTFSAHLQHLKAMLNLSGPSTLLGMDEIGDGTDPRFGGPIAQAVLEALRDKGCFAIVTTHYSRLKEWGGHSPEVINASMVYDTKALQPLYKLVAGKPGSSFALELLRKTGFEDSIISRVQDLAGEESGKTEELLLDLEQKQHELTALLEENHDKEARLNHLLGEYQKLKEKLETKKAEVMEAARQKARGLLDDANRQIELTIRTIREHGADKMKTTDARNKLRQFAEDKVEKDVLPVPPVANPVALKKAAPVKWLPGMQVKSLINEARGEVLEVKKGRLLVSFGLLKMWVEPREVEPATSSGEVKKNNISGFNWVERQAGFSPELDLRGVLADEALKKMNVWLEEAYVLGQYRLKIIHGRGDGILRKVLRQHFKTIPWIRSFHSEKEEMGGDGCTIVELN
ncbi:MAG: Smr/MutS family protein [Bacteroidetes bacterium]|nr:Smr/MutS family protein [Bacteroidota bacterium]